MASLVAPLVRATRASEQTHDRWRKKYGRRGRPAQILQRVRLTRTKAFGAPFGIGCWTRRSCRRLQRMKAVRTPSGGCFTDPYAQARPSPACRRGCSDLARAELHADPLRRHWLTLNAPRAPRSRAAPVNTAVRRPKGRAHENRLAADMTELPPNRAGTTMLASRPCRLVGKRWAHQAPLATGGAESACEATKEGATMACRRILPPASVGTSRPCPSLGDASPACRAAGHDLVLCRTDEGKAFRTLNKETLSTRQAGRHWFKSDG